MNLSKKLLSVCGKNVFFVCYLKKLMRAIRTMLKLNNDKSTKTFIYDSTDYVRCAVLSSFRKPTSSIHWHLQTDNWELQINNIQRTRPSTSESLIKKGLQSLSWCWTNAWMSMLKLSEFGVSADWVACSHLSNRRANSGNKGCLKHNYNYVTSVNSVGGITELYH